jgi:hypothetical protein
MPLFDSRSFVTEPSCSLSRLDSSTSAAVAPKAAKKGPAKTPKRKAVPKKKWPTKAERKLQIAIGGYGGSLLFVCFSLNAVRR